MLGRTAPGPLFTCSTFHFPLRKDAAYDLLFLRQRQRDELWQRGRVRATLEYRQPIDVEEAVVLIVEGARVWLVVADEVRAAARYDEIP